MASPQAKRTGRVRHDAHYDLSASPTLLSPAAYLMMLLLNSDRTLPGLKAECMEFFDKTEQEFGLRPATNQTAPTAAPVVAETQEGQPAVVSPSPPAPEAPEVNKRSEGARQAWETRRAVTAYMNEHTGISRDDAFEAVIASIPGRTRVTGDDAPMTRGRKAWNTRVDREMLNAEEAGAPISREEAKAIVSRKMRGDRRASATTPPADDQRQDDLQQAA